MNNENTCTPAADYFNRRENDKKPLVPKPVAYALAAALAIILSVVIGLTVWAIQEGNERLECAKARPFHECPAPTPLERAVYHFWQIG